MFVFDRTGKVRRSDGGREFVKTLGFGGGQDAMGGGVLSEDA